MKEKIIVDGIDAFLRQNYGEFSTQSINKFFRSVEIDLQGFDVLSYLKSHPLTFQITETSFIARASVFSDAYFCISPTKLEITKGILIPGHRCMPFIDPEMYPHEIQFTFNSIPLGKMQESIPLPDIMDATFLYGEEYIPQLLAADPANKNHDFAKNDYSLPNIVEISVVDMANIYESFDFQYGDRLLAKVTDWNKGIVNIQVQKSCKKSPFEITEEDELREEWFSIIDEAILHTISTQGPLSSMEEQLAYTFYTHSASLCTEFCSSTEEYMGKNASISIEYYGVESRLWKKDEEIPAIGSWNDNIKESDELINTLYEEIGIPIPFYMLDAYIFDALFRNEKGLKDIYNRMVPDKSILDESQADLFLTHIQDRYGKLEKNYNRFVDFETGEVRARSLELYSALIKLICELDSCGVPASSLPQQQLVIVSQLFSHTTKFLEAFMTEVLLSKEDIAMISTSLDGMNESFDDVSADLVLAMGKNNKDGFSII